MLHNASNERTQTHSQTTRAIPALLLTASAVLVIALAAGPRSAADPGTQDSPTKNKPAENEPAERGPAKAAATKSVQLGQLDAIRVADDLFCGPQPRTAQDFAALKAQGIQTVIGLDGVVPNAQLARQAGLKYVHLPVGFNQAEQQVPALLATLKSAKGPCYLHCRYGRPRTPAMVAMVAQVRYGWNQAQASEWAKQAGVGESYQGLAASLASFRPPAADAVRQAKVPSGPAKTTPLVHTMAALLDDWEPIRKAAAAEFKDYSPEQLNRLAVHAVGVEKHLRGLTGDAIVSDWGQDFADEMAEAAAAAQALAAACRAAAASGNVEPLPQAMKAAGSRCGACHTTYRN